jgi:AcrR family transcriptional regulator
MRNNAVRAASDPVETTAARVGRPPRVSARDIIAAAIEIGLEGVTLKQVADRLDVAVPTLYRHVRSRDELVRLAAFELTLVRRLPDGADLHWSEIATGYAVSLFESFVSEPQLIHEVMKGRLGPEAEVDFLERFLEAVGSQGFGAEDAVKLHHAVAMQAIGAAVGAIAINAAQSQGQPLARTLREAVTEREAEAVRRVRAIIDFYLDERSSMWLGALRALLGGIAASRGETLPKTLRTFVPSPRNRRVDGDRTASEENRP